MPRVLAALSKLSPGTLLAMGLLLLGATLFEAWVLVLRQPLGAYREAAAAREALSAIERMTVAQDEELRRASARARQLADRLGAELQAPTPEEQLTVSLMRQLDQAAGRAGIALTSLKPAARRQVLSFEEVSFEVGAQGKYLPLCQWLLGFEQSLGKFATVSDLTMRSVDEGRQVGLSLRLALYRPRLAGGGEK
jgi:Tfp pilus assembly protein PilO